MATASGVDPRQGLSDAEVRHRLATHGPNRLPPPERTSTPARFAAQLREPMSLLLICAAAISGVWLGEVVDAAAIAAIVVLNAVIAVVQEGRAAHALEALEAMEAQRATVRRRGHVRDIDATQVVPGDVVVIRAGDRVPADLRLLTSGSVAIDESLLTGESLAAAKDADAIVDVDAPLAERPGSALAGTLVTRGEATGVCIATGSDTALGDIAAGLRDERRAPTPLQRELAGVSRRLGLAAIVIAGGVFALSLLRTGTGTEGLQTAFLTAVALAVAAVPEGLAAVTTVALALGVRRMADRGAIIRRLPAVETLGSTSVLAIDKTGTVTENRMRLAEVVDGAGSAHPADHLPPAIRTPLGRAAALCSDAEPGSLSGDPTEVALLALLPPSEIAALRRGHPRVDAVPFDSERKWMATLHRHGDGWLLAAKGAPEMLLSRCATARTAADAAPPVDDAARAMLEEQAEEAGRRGMRVIAVAERRLSSRPIDLAGAVADLELLGLVGLRDPARSSASRSVEEVRSAGMHLLMVTGDHPGTASAIAEEIGLPGRHQVTTGRDLRVQGLPDDPTTRTVYARVDPDQKLALVERLQERRHTVAMTGDGVNDAPALRRADIGVALGRSGSAVAREASDMVITDDDLASIVVAVREGRGIFDNITRVVDYLVAANLAEIATVVVGLLAFPWLGVPLLPLQLLWMNLLTDGLPALALGVDPIVPDVMRRPPRAPGQHLLGGRRLLRLAGIGAVIALAPLSATVAADRWLGMDATAARTVLFTSLVVAQIAFMSVVRGGIRRRAERVNRWMVAAVATAALAQLAVVQWPTVGTVFGTVPLGGAGWLLATGTGLGAVGLLHLLRLRPRPMETMVRNGGPLGTDRASDR